MAFSNAQIQWNLHNLDLLNYYFLALFLLSYVLWLFLLFTIILEILYETYKSIKRWKLNK